MLEVQGQVRDEVNQLGPKSPERREDMEDIVEMKEGPARPMVVVTDRDGSHWLCDEGIDPKKGLEEQGCWQCGDEHFAFTRDD
jgi:streptogramin lyase